MAQNYTFEELRIEVAENVSYDTGAGAIQSGKNLTEGMIGKYINRRYSEVLNVLIESYPEDYIRSSTADFFKKEVEILTITDDTLVITTSDFVNGMVGDTIYNSTQSDSAVIGSYSSGTTVVLTSEPDWDVGDSLVVLGHEFTLGGDAADAKYPTQVRVRYNSSWTDSRTCEWISQTDSLKTGYEVYSQFAPRVYRTSLKVAGVPKLAIGILPEPTVPVTQEQGGIELDYIEFPAKLTNDEDIPQMPQGTQHYLIAGATIDALRKLKRFDEASVYEREWGVALPMIIKTYARSRVTNSMGKRSNIIDLRLRRR